VVGKDDYNPIVLAQFWHIHILVAIVLKTSDYTMVTVDTLSPEEEFKMTENIHLTYRFVEYNWIPEFGFYISNVKG